ncbi:hypothetical protein [Ornithobacterium rhinotracheale]|uniref:hypothetical protein n=1 Tax=Ornithobacterium rhinotracheale TaxID=28251 RepID=UPI001FF375AF|nr:hypothetical protein [Ornithobacterium rhinotracheale]MCK0201392.1 hypothetical protein [Ornithobacterium rhinotracheale]
MIDLSKSEVMVADNAIIFKEGQNNILEVPIKVYPVVMPTAKFKRGKCKCQIRISKKQEKQINQYLKEANQFINEIKSTLL